MKIEEPDWVGKRMECLKCSTRFTLEADDEDKVQYVRSAFPEAIRIEKELVAMGIDDIKSEKERGRNAKVFGVSCPKCGQKIEFTVMPKE